MPFLGRITHWYWYQTGVVPVPLTRTKVVPVPRQSGTGTNLQNRVGTGTDLNGNVPLLPTALISCIFILLSPNSYTDSIGTLVND